MKKIMFNDKYGLTKAVLEGKKTQTRWLKAENRRVEFGQMYLESLLRQNKTHFRIGEILAVAQSYETIENEWLKKCPCPLLKNESFNCDKCSLGPDSCFDKYVPLNFAGWNNKMFVKADLMPHQIRITDIRLERLQNISSEDCLKEGIKKSWWMGSSGKYLYGFGGHEDKWESPKEAYAALIDSISGKGTWGKNPWVFVYDFELVK